MVQYEADGAQRPGVRLARLSLTLHVSTDALLGLTPVKTPRAPKTTRLPKRLQQIEEVPPADQRIVPKLIDALVDALDDSRRRTTPAKRARKAS